MAFKIQKNKIAKTIFSLPESKKFPTQTIFPSGFPLPCGTQSHPDRFACYATTEHISLRKKIST